MALRRDKLFLHVCVDLHACCRDGRTYSLLRAAALLRLLLVDGGALATRVNKEHRVQLLFHVGLHDDHPYVAESPRPLLSLYHSSFDGAAAGPSPLWSTERVDLERFLALRVIRRSPQTFSVREVIKHVANVNGIMHAGDPKKELEHSLMKLRPFVPVGSEEPVTAMVGVIGAVALRALHPLFTAVRAAVEARDEQEAAQARARGH